MSSDADARAVTLLALLVERATGLHYPARDRDLLVGKLRDHADQRGFENLLDFYRSVEYDDPDGARLEALVDALVVGETYFFRERHGLERIVEIVTARAARGEKTRIWSAACATGEEVLSLGALLGVDGLLDSVELVASDLSARQLARARRGEYTLRALRTAPDGLPPWICVREGIAVVAPALRARVSWSRINLVDTPAVAALGRFDVILCRNVLFYFDDTTVVRVVGQLADSLTPGGTLLIGTSESLLRFATQLTCVERRGTFLYLRPEGNR